MKPDNKVFKAYYTSKKKSLYFNEIKELSGLSDSSLSNTLKSMVDNNIMHKTRTKSNTYYEMKNIKLFQLKFSEIALEQFDTLNHNIKMPLTHFLKDIPIEVYTIILFGSASRKNEGKNSDIDIMIVSIAETSMEKQKKNAEITSKHNISLFSISLKEFKENNDNLIVQARQTGFPIYKEQNFYEEILDGH
jgi:predicted nucleotidyltransferase